jgi:hypothetical protein
VELDADEFLSLPRRVREIITGDTGHDNAETLRHDKTKYKQWLFSVPAGTSLDDYSTIVRIFEFAKLTEQFATQRREALAEEKIKRLVDMYLEGEPRPQIDAEIDRDNAKLRANYLKKVPAYSAAEIRAQLLKAKPKNTSEPASRWKREQRVFAVRHDGKDLFPAFQFADGAPLPIIRKILKALPDDMTPWQVAFWFASGNGWLDGETPEECLKDERDVVFAAEQQGALVG